MHITREHTRGFYRTAIELADPLVLESPDALEVEVTTTLDNGRATGRDLRIHGLRLGDYPMTRSGLLQMLGMGEVARMEDALLRSWDMIPADDWPVGWHPMDRAGATVRRPEVVA